MHAEGISGFVLNSRQLNCILLNLLGKSHEEEQNKACSHVYPPNRPGKIQAYKILNTFFLHRRGSGGREKQSPFCYFTISFSGRISSF